MRLVENASTNNLEQIGQTSIVEEGNVNNNKEYDVKKREYDNNLTKKFRSTMLKDAAVKMQYKQSIEAQLDQYVDIVDFRLYLVYYYSRLVNCYCYSLKILQPRILWYSYPMCIQVNLMKNVKN